MYAIDVQDDTEITAWLKSRIPGACLVQGYLYLLPRDLREIKEYILTGNNGALFLQSPHNGEQVFCLTASAA